MRAIFLDRDGVINQYPGDNAYVTSVKNFVLLPRVPEALRILKDAGFLLFVVSNQAGVGKGFFTRVDLDAITRKMVDQLRAAGVDLDGVYYCTHTDFDQCACRKPKAGLIVQAVEEARQRGVRIDLKRSYLIGDSLRDIETGKTAQVKTLLVFSGKEVLKQNAAISVAPDRQAKDLFEAAHVILEAEGV